MDHPHVKPQVGLSLAGGAARGLAHLGIIDFLNEFDCRYQALAGCSAGSIVAALVACGQTPDEIQSQIRGFTFKQTIKLTWPVRGLSRTSRLSSFFKTMFQDKTFEQTKVPLRIVATDLDSGEPVVFDSGPLWPAVTASCCLPGLFEPFSWQGKNLVDGGLVALNPTALLHDCPKILGSDLGLFRVRIGPVKGFLDHARQSLELLAKAQRQANDARADIMIRPEVLESSFFDFSKASKLRRLGYEACLEKKQEILDLFN